MCNSNFLKLIVSTIGLFIAISFGNAQIDSSRVNYSEELKDSSDYKFRRTYQYLDINLKNERMLFKLSPGYSFSHDRLNLNVNLGIERKVEKSFSIIVTNQLYYQTTEKYDNYYFNTIGTGFRYYSSLKKRINQGISGNNLNGLYFEFGLNNIVTFFSLSNEIIFFRLPDPSFSFGIQRRLNNWSFFDIFSKSYFVDGFFYSSLGFNIGFAWGNKN